VEEHVERTHISDPDSNTPPAAEVIVVDDHAAALQGVSQLVGRTSGLVVIGEADSGEAAVALVQELKPDVVLMDVRMPGIGGIAATRAIKAMRRSTVVVLVSTTHPDDLREEATNCGADEIVWKQDLRRNVLERISRRHVDACALAEPSTSCEAPDSAVRAPLSTVQAERDTRSR